jgi:hypothetical protein
MNESTLGVHEIELVVKAREDLSNGSRVGDHAHGALDLGEITTGHNSRGLVVDSAFETGRAPINKLNGTLGLDGGNSSVDILGDDITTVHKAASHVLTVTRIALGHHGRGLECRVGDLGNRELLVVGLLSRDDRSIGRKHEVNARIRDQVGLELGDIHVQSTIEPERCGQRRDDLSDQSVKIGVGGAFNVEGTTADVVDSLVIEHDGDISVLKEGVGGEHRVVGLDDSGGDLGGGVDGESEFGLLAIVNRQTFQEEGSETGTGTSTDGIEDQETLETSAVVGELTNAVQAHVDNLLANGVVTTSEVIGGIFLTRDELFRVEQLTVSASANLIDHSRFKIDKDTAGDVLASSSLREEGVESIIGAADGLVRGHSAIGLNAVL